MTVGGLQTLARSYRVAPGERIVIAGNGPLCLQTAAELLDGGANVVAVLEAAPRPGLAQARALASAAVADPFLMIDGLSLAVRLGSKLHWNRRATRLIGDDRVRGIEAGDLRFEADIVALNYGFASSSELARSLGCAHRFVPRGNGSMETLTDADGRTSLAEVFAIGDGARFGGAHAAMAQGALAAAAIAADLGHKIAEPREARRTQRRAARFQAALWQMFDAPAIDPDAIDDGAVVCRCEEVTAGELRRLIAAGHDSPAALKRACRVGMGRCQGRYCASVVARMTTAEVGEFGLFAPRPPAKPVPIRALTVEQPEWTGHKDFVPPDMARPREVGPLPAETVDTLVIGGGVAGSCLAYWLAREGIEALVVERDDVNLQASGANAGSLHVQLLAFDFALGAPPNNRAADTLPLGPGLGGAVAGDPARHRRGPRDEGLRRADAGRERARHRLPQGQDRAGEEPRHRGRADRRQRAARAGALHRRRRHRRRMVPGRGQDQSAEGHLRRGRQGQGAGRALPARQQRLGDRTRRHALEGFDQPRRDPRQARRQHGGAVGGRGRAPGRSRHSLCAARPCRWSSPSPRRRRCRAWSPMRIAISP